MSKCVLGAHNDNIAIKSGRDADGPRINKPTTNVVVFGCTMNGNWGVITCDSEITGGVSNVYAYNCAIVGRPSSRCTWRRTPCAAAARRTSTWTTSPATRNFAYVRSTYNSRTGSNPINFGNINITNCTTTSVPKLFDLEGTSTYHVHGVQGQQLQLQRCGQHRQHLEQRGRPGIQQRQGERQGVSK